MSSEAEYKIIDGWGKFKILSQALLGIGVAAFTGVFGTFEHMNAKAKLELAHSNIKIAQAKAQATLIPALSSENPRRRALAISLANTLDPEFASMVSVTAIMRDSSEIVQRSAKLNLEQFAMSRHGQVKESAAKALNHHALMKEVAALGLQEDLASARNYIEGGGPDGKEKAVGIYRRTLEKLPDATLLKLDQNLLRTAQEDERNGYWDSAARKYMAMFPQSAY